MKFNELEIKSEIKKAIEEKGFVEATEIQTNAIPVALEGHDVLGQAQTGTGKTLSFLIPILERVDPTNKDVQALVLVPTRELAVQIHEEAEKFAKYLDIDVLSIYGGDSIDRQIKKLKDRPQVVIGTPGRTIDLLNRRKLKVQGVTMFVLDEVDEMLNMGFLDDVETIFTKLPRDKQILFYSATMEKRIKNLTNNFLKDPVHIQIDAKSLTVDKVEQSFIMSKANLKAEVVRDLLLLRGGQKVIIFVQTKRMCDEMYDFLNESGFRINKIHGDIVQKVRLNTINDFRNNKFDVLVATDVVARGIDIDDIDLVINMQLPQDREYYIHRIGRTARGNSEKGEAITIVTAHEYKTEFKFYEKYLKASIAEIQRPSNEDITNKLMWEYFNKIDNNINGKVDEAYVSLSELLLNNHNEHVLVPYLLKLLYPQLSADYKITHKKTSSSSEGGSHGKNRKSSGGRGGNRGGGNRGGGNRSGGNRSGGNRSGGNRDGGNRSGGNRDGGNRDGGRNKSGSNSGSRRSK